MFDLRKNFFNPPFDDEGGQSSVILLAIVPIGILIALMLPRVEMTVALGVGMGIFFFAVAFVKTEIALYLLILSMLLSPEIGVSGGGGEGGMEARRSVALRLDDFLLVVMGLSYLGRMAIDKNIGVVGKTPLNKFIGIYLMACIISTITGIMMGNVRMATGFFFVLKYFEYYVVFYAVINYIHKEEQVRSFTIVILLTCLVVCFIGMAQIPAGGRITAPFEGTEGEPNTLGGYLILLLALNGGLYLHLTVSWVRKLLFINFFIILLPLLGTGSRGSWLALPFVYLVWVIFSEKKLLLIVLGITAMLLVPAMMPKSVKDRLQYTFTQESAKHRRQIQVGTLRLDTSTSARIDSMARVIKDWQKRPIQGYGVTGYRFVDAQYFKVLADTGILGLMAFLALLIKLFSEIYKVFKAVKSPLHKGIAHGFLAGLTGMCIHAVGANTFIIVRIMEPFWFLAGIVIMLPALEAREEAARLSSQEEGVSPPLAEKIPSPEISSPHGSSHGHKERHDQGQPSSGRNIDLLR